MAVSNLVAMLVFRTIMAPSAEHLVQAVGWRTAQRYAASICVGPAVLCALLVRGGWSQVELCVPPVAAA